ncbi:MAG: cobalt ECF transporter T component CbiQ [Desulfovibrionaceae bacterium]|nr:cobalt ECF transporter T component CbiQ [Desulfovibrionaceae bacterium]
MFDEPFAAGTSLIHSLDPRIRLGVAVACSIVCSIVHSLPAALLALGAALVLVCLSRPPLRPLLRRMAVVNIFILFLWLTVPLSQQGNTPVLASYGFFVLTQQGLDLCLLVTVKSNALVLLFLALVATMPTPTLGHAMAQLAVPNKLVFLFLFTYRYVHVIGEEWQRLHNAARLRGFSPRNNLHTYRVAGYILGMVLVRSYERAHRVYEAMLLRGFNGRFTSVSTFQAAPRDALFCCTALTTCVLIMAVDYWEIFCV